jgi:antitoxin (DNA-binding transcriptional repressor) of toxin-antitoxin stability system
MPLCQDWIAASWDLAVEFSADKRAASNQYDRIPVQMVIPRLEHVLGATVSVTQAKSQFAALVARAEAGERIIVTRSGCAIACLGPLPGRQPIKYGELRGVFLAEDLAIPEEVIRDFEPGK